MNLPHGAKTTNSRQKRQVLFYPIGKLKTGEELALKQLQELAHEVVSALTIQRKDIAAMLKVSPSAITRATKEVGTKWTALQIRLIGTFSNLAIESQTIFRVTVRGSRDRN